MATIIGTQGDDDGNDNPIILGTEGHDVIHGLGEDDLILGFCGDDLICAGDGDDSVRGDGLTPVANDNYTSRYNQELAISYEFLTLRSSQIFNLE